VFVYQLKSYQHWERYFGTADREYGQFGENFTVDGLPDDQVCVGDRYRIGETEFEVTQPRVTCYRVGLRLGQPELPALLVSHHRPGFYLRVITEGGVQAGDEIIKTRTGPGALSVADTDALLYLPGHEPALLRRALDIPALSPGWQGSFRDLLAGAEAGSGAGGGPASAVAAAPAWAGFRPLRVTRIVPESGSVSSIWFNDSSGSPLPTARAGQYLTVRIPLAGRPAAVRSYSLSSAPGDGSYRISVKHEPQSVASGYLDTALRAGDTLDAAAPRGDFVSTATGTSGGCTAPAARSSVRSRPKLTRCSPPCPARTSTSSTAAWTAGCPRTNWPGWVSRPAPAPTSAGRPGSWRTCRRPWPRSASTRPASTPSCSGRFRPSTPVWSASTAGRRTRRTDRPGPGHR
jgi:MOSC domain-containing protein YiiM